MYIQVKITRADTRYAILSMPSKRFRKFNLYKCLQVYAFSINYVHLCVIVIFHNWYNTTLICIFHLSFWIYIIYIILILSRNEIFLSCHYACVCYNDFTFTFILHFFKRITFFPCSILDMLLKKNYISTLW